MLTEKISIMLISQNMKWVQLWSAHTAPLACRLAYSLLWNVR